MARSVLLLCVLLLGTPPGRLSADILVRAQQDVFSAETNTHLLMSSSQATLTRMQWDFGRWGLKKQKSAAAADFKRVTGKITNYRELAAQVGSVTDPLAHLREKIEKSAKVRAAAKKIPETAAGQVEEIHRLRAEYDADASRSALIRASSRLSALQKEFGLSGIKKSQTRVLALARDILADIRTTRLRTSRSLPEKSSDTLGSHRKGRSLIMKNLAMLEADAEDLGAEIARLEIHYQLNNYIKDGVRK